MALDFLIVRADVTRDKTAEFPGRSLPGAGDFCASGAAFFAKT